MIMLFMIAGVLYVLDKKLDKTNDRVDKINNAL